VHINELSIATSDENNALICGCAGKGNSASEIRAKWQAEKIRTENYLIFIGLDRKRPEVWYLVTCFSPAGVLSALR